MKARVFFLHKRQKNTAGTLPCSIDPSSGIKVQLRLFNKKKKKSLNKLNEQK